VRTGQDQSPSFKKKKKKKDWQQKLIGFERDGSFLIAASHYNTDFKLYLKTISDFSEFIDLIDYVGREQFDIDKFLILIFLDDLYLDNFYNSRKGTSNFSQFFKDMRDFVFVEKWNDIELLENKYNSTRNYFWKSSI
jgi:hypothetical protein